MTKKNNKYALISVSNKSNILFLSQKLIEYNYNLISTKGTYLFLKSQGFNNIIEISEYLNYSKLMDEKVKTLHPKLYRGILSDRSINDIIFMHINNIKLIDIVVINFYPFKQSSIQKKINDNIISSNIDIGGPCIVRAAAKNYKHVTVVIDNKDYLLIINELKKNNSILLDTRIKLAQKAFNYVSLYDKKISEYFNIKEQEIKSFKNNEKNFIFPNKITLNLFKKEDLRYGENHHQKSALYYTNDNKYVKNNNFKQIQGKKLSYNNIIDANVALECVQEFSNPSCVIIKHANPCGVSSSHTLKEAYINAYNTDPISYFGSVIAFNKQLNLETVNVILKNNFIELIIIPSITNEAKILISKKNNIRILLYNFNSKILFEMKCVSNGILIQNTNLNYINKNNINIVSKRIPKNNEIEDIIFGWKIVKFVKSNAIIYCKNNMTLGIGAGQMSRIDSVKLAITKAKERKFNLQGSSMISDAFFPFRDSIDFISNLGIKCIIQPGGSLRDQEIIDAVNQHNLSMVFTNIRSFRH
ncbi:bifunctional phosphoribosylaminoimidazolecarboxamide formyltransferase/IMP cyclohydrolase [Enterobacteriaceae endosymbiont of Plateumaris sericea]|uniref:bifunctional phosphoribosylaminoimidazolecarboxamide formyltransferase/IMP cyclohydrolase n=1 Tax=Enterobacteriaceae endosymbiont of Plateumaris sericea TaxID=2675797 RepID=UPI001449FAFF|nr:bifunctional phosphoribosylaminoimidazolecarboxamide formyltransferase/IMP cyclohydrolase [Enterobacteriaceae endosymbiont of Plateumaris sericea]QJC29936.1 bifunctional phosphoribosylaminoimidazolecarboxamide formyltransferase/IMP cyclohydrolase [Enterobacteriaceae endosymbiont of Plateumaris sericea]